MGNNKPSSGVNNHTTASQAACLESGLLKKMLDLVITENKATDIFLNKRNKNNFINLQTKITQSIIECFLNTEQAVINSEITLEEVRQKLPLCPFPEIGNNDFETVVDEALKLLLKESPIPNFASPNFFGQIHPALNQLAIAGNNIAAILNQNAIAEEVSPMATQMENQIISNLASLIGYDIEKAGGNVVGGGTAANHTAMLVARNKTVDSIAELGPIKALKLYNEKNGTDYEDLAIIAAEDNHYSIEKQAGYIGIGKNNIYNIPYGANGNLHMGLMEKIIEQAENDKKLIIGAFITGGTTESGKIHDIDGVINVAKNIGQNGREIYVHIDGAIGGAFLVNEEIKENKFKGIEKADSVTIDGHKMFYTNYSCGTITFKDKEDLKLIEQTANYIFNKNSGNENHGSTTIEGSRSIEGIIQLFLSIKFLGKKGYKEILDKTIGNAQKFAEIIKDSDDFELLGPQGDLNFVCFRFIGRWNDTEKTFDQVNERAKKTSYQNGNVYIGDTIIDGKTCFKAVFMNHSTGERNMQKVLEEIRTIYFNIE